jgi:DNA repair exonuclease SbcCD ATPase subunit
VQKAILIPFIIILVILASCQTLKATPNPNEAAVAYREIQEELHTRQTETALTGAKIELGSREIVAGLDALETAMTAVPESESLRPQVQTLKTQALELQNEAIVLNQQLADERETNSRLNLKFNDYETSQTKELAKKDTEINTLKVENKKLTGQRNTLLAIVITAITVILLIVAVKVLRVLKVIPL